MVGTTATASVTPATVVRSGFMAAYGFCVSSAHLHEIKAALPRIAVLAGIWAGLVGLLIAAGEVVVHSAAVTDFDRHATRVVVSSRTAALDSVMKVVTWLGSWVALAVTAGIVALLVLTRRLPVL